MPVRETLKLIYRSLMIFITVVLGGGSVLAFLNATPANGLMLVGGILAILTLMAGLSIFKLDWQDAEAETLRSIIQDIPKAATINVSYAEPEVHKIDEVGMQQAKRMAGEGASIEDICRAIDPAYDAKDEAHQGAFRAIVRMMIKEG